MNQAEERNEASPGEIATARDRVPLRRNMHWRELRRVLEQIGDVVHEKNGHLKLELNGHTISLTPGTGEVGVETVVELRRFLEQSTAQGAGDAAPSPWVVVMDRHEARIFHSDAPKAPLLRITSHAHERHSGGFREFAEHITQRSHFFKAVAMAIAAAPEVRLVGNGKGAASEAEIFAQWLASHRKESAPAVTTVQIDDKKHLTDLEQLAAVRAYCEELRGTTASSGGRDI